VEKRFYDDQEHRWRSNHDLSVTKIIEMLPGGFGWVLAAFSAVTWYIAYKVMISPAPGLHRNYFDPGLWAMLAFTNGSLVRFVMVKHRQRKWERSHPPAKDFGS